MPITPVTPWRMRLVSRLCRAWLPMLVAAAGCEPVTGGRVDSSGPGGLEVLFRVGVDGAGNAFVPASDGVRLYADVDRRIEAFDLASGIRLWSYTRPPGGPSALVARAGRVMFAGDSAVALDASTGREIWKRGLDSYAGFAESDGDAEAFFTGTEQRYIYAFRASDGELLWRTQVGADWPHGGVVRGMTLSGDTLYAIVEHNTGVNGHIGTGDVFAMDRRTGAVHWVYRNGNGNGLNIFQSAARVAGPLLLLTANWDNQFLAIDRFSHAEAWRFSAGFSFAGPQEAPEIRGNVAYVASHAENAVALELATGRPLWTTRIRGGGNWLAVCGSRLLVHASGLEVLDLETGRSLGRGLGPESAEVLGTDLVVVGNRAYVFGLRNLYGLECPT